MATTKVQSEHIAINAISGTIIADNAITSVHIAQNAILTKHIDDGQVGTSQLAADAVTGAKLADSSVVTANIQDNQVTGDKLTDNITIAGTLTSTGTITGTLATAAQTNITSLGTLTTLTVDDITLNGSTISDSGDFTLDIGGDIILDAGGQNWYFDDDGTRVFSIAQVSSDVYIGTEVADKDMIFRVNDSDGGGVITALTLDASAAGYGTFNNWIKVNDRVVGNSNLVLNTSDGNEKMHLDASGYIKLETAGTERMRITSAGNVGIGETSPDARLHVYTTGYPVGKFERYGSSTATRGWTQIGHSALGYSGSTGADTYIVAQHGFGFAVNEGTNAMTITDGGNVGIGTASPQELLHLTATTPVFRLEGGSRTYQQFVDSTSFYIRDVNAGANRFTLDSSGNVTLAGNIGIGTTYTGYGLNIGTSNEGLALISSDANNVAMSIRYNGTNSGGTTAAYFATHASMAGSGTDKEFGIYIQNSLPFNIGMGTSKKVTVNTDGTLRVLTDGSASSACFQVGSDADTGMYQPAANQLGFTVAGSRKMYFSTTTAYMQNLSSGLVLDAAIGTRGAGISEMSVTSGSNGNQTVVWRFGANAGNTIGYFVNNNNAGVYMNSGNTSWSAHSDERVKENITLLGTVLPNIDNLRCVKYNRIGDTGADRTKIGFIAQDWESKFSEVVDEDDGFVIEDDGTVGAIKDSESTTLLKGISYTETIPVLLKAIQELKAENTALKARVTTLEG